MPHEAVLTGPAPCAEKTSLFFSDLLVEQEAAKRVCHDCPFRASCLRKAFQHQADGGIWGGFDDVERGIYRKLYGADVGERVKALPASVVRRLKANKVIRTAPDLELAGMVG